MILWVFFDIKRFGRIYSVCFFFFFSFSFILSLSSRSRRSRSSLYRFRIVTSVIPAMSATSLWVFFSSWIRAATYSAAAAIPAGPLPEVSSEISAFCRILRASFWEAGERWRAEENREM